MKLILFTFAILQLASFSASCPTECYCFGFNGEWIADCARKGLTSVTFSDFDANTTEIHMQYNDIETLHVNTFSNVGNLRHLYLQSNKITSLPDGIFNGLTELETLRINSNRITDIGTSKFSDLSKLQLLYIHDNDLKQVVNRALEGLDKLEQVSIAGNPNLASIALNVFRPPENLTMIDMSGSALTNINPALVTGLNLDKVYTYDIDTLDCNEIQPYLTYMLTHPLSAFGRTSMVCAEPEYLRGRSVVAVNPDKHIVEPGSCPDSCTCFGSGTSFIADCSSRELTAVPQGFAPETTEIFLQNNQITSLLDNDFLHLIKLEYLHLHDNQIGPLGLNAFTGAAQTLKQLTLNNNRIDTLTVGVFNGMRSLEVLNLNDNEVTVVGPGEFSDMVSLVQLSINNNSLRILPGAIFSNLVSLKYIGLAQNAIQNIPDNLLANSANLYFVDLSENPFLHLPKLPATATRIEIRNSHIMSLSASSFADAENLAVLDLSGNRVYVIEEGTFAGAKKLQYIYLPNNHMEEITDDTFASAPELMFLDLTGNSKLAVISENAFFAQRQTLERIDLDNCGITTMNAKAFSLMQHPNFYAKLEGNPWNCDCKLQDLSSFISTYPGKVDEPTCKEPKSRQGRMVADITYEEACTIAAPEDDSLALVMSLSIVGAVVIFAVIGGLIIYKSNKSTKKKMASYAKQKPTSDNGNGTHHSNDAFDNDETHGSAVQM